LLAAFERDVVFDVEAREPFAEVVVVGAGVCPATASRFISRALRRAALLRCRTPFETARSSAEMATPTSSSALSTPSVTPRRNLVILVLTDERIERLRWARMALRFASFLADCVLARG
jgi:hypothetical protein